MQPPAMWLLMGLMGVFGAAGHYLLVLAYSRASVATLTPFLYLQVFFATLGGWLVFSHIPDHWSIAGMVLIAVCGTGGAWLAFRDANCQFSLVPVSATVTAVSSGLSFTVSFSGSYADDFYNLGTVEFLTGALAGTARVEIFDWTSAGVITLFVPLAEVPTIGDTLELKQGCPKTRTACRDTFANVLNFGGFPEVPGSDQVLKSAEPSGT